LLLDGTRDRGALLRELAQLIKSGAITVNRTGKPAADIDEAITDLEEELDRSLNSLARRAVLVA
jgi:hypothetical protein